MFLIRGDFLIIKAKTPKLFLIFLMYTMFFILFFLRTTNVKNFRSLNRNFSGFIAMIFFCSISYSAIYLLKIFSTYCSIYQTKQCWMIFLPRSKSNDRAKFQYFSGYSKHFLGCLLFSELRNKHSIKNIILLFRTLALRRMFM